MATAITSFITSIPSRLANGFTFEGMGQREWARLAVVLLVYIVVRPWLIKGGGTETHKQYEEMEARDKARMDKEKAERDAKEAVARLRGAKPASLEVVGTAGARDLGDEEEAAETSGQDMGSWTLEQKATHRALAAGEARRMMEEEERVRKLENWDEDEEFLRNFATASDRANLKRY